MLARLQGCFAGGAEGQAGAPRNEGVHPRAAPALGPAPLLPRLAEQVLFFPFPRLPLGFSLTPSSSPGKSKQGREGSWQQVLRRGTGSPHPTVPPPRDVSGMVAAGDAAAPFHRGFPALPTPLCSPPWLLPGPRHSGTPNSGAGQTSPPLPGQAKQPGVGRLLRAGGQIAVRAHFGLAHPLSPPQLEALWDSGAAPAPLAPPALVL